MARPRSLSSTPSTWTPRASPSTRRPASSGTAPSWSRNSAASAQRKRPAAMATSRASSPAWRTRSRPRSASRTSRATGPTSASATSIRSRRRCPRTLSPRATSAMRPTLRRMIGSSVSITPSCARRPRIRSEVPRACPVGPIPDTPHPPPRGDSTMNPKVLRWLTPGCLAATALIATTIALGSSGRDDPPARAAGNFSPYVTKDGGISRPTDYRDTFEYLGSYAVATKPDKPLDEMHIVYARPEDVRAYRRDGKFPDGATLVKEVTRVGSERLTTGQSHWATDIKLWFVMIKDAKGRFPGNDLWGATAGAAPSSWRKSPRAMWQPTIRPTAGYATSRPARTTGCTSADTLRSEG